MLTLRRGLRHWFTPLGVFFLRFKGDCEFLKQSKMLIIWLENRFNSVLDFIFTAWKGHWPNFCRCRLISIINVWSRRHMANFQDHCYWVSDFTVFLHQSCDWTSEVLINKTASRCTAFQGRFSGAGASSKQRKWIYFHVHFRCFVGNFSGGVNILAQRSKKWQCRRV